MAESRNTFSRKETKYVLEPAQLRPVAEAVRGSLREGEYGTSRVNSIYLDTPALDSIARSVEKPAYKEKLRLRWYGTCALDDAPAVFVELKKKLKGVVYKRRLPVTPDAARAFAEGAADALTLATCAPRVVRGADDLASECPAKREGGGGTSPVRPAGCAEQPVTCPFPRKQIAGELVAAQRRLRAKGCVSPSVLVACERDSYGTDADGGLRVTFDGNVRAFDMRTPVPAVLLLPEGSAVMEVKCGGGYPLWLVRVLGEAKAYPASFSKYGAFYAKTSAPMPVCNTRLARPEAAPRRAAILGAHGVPRRGMRPACTTSTH